MTNTKVILVTGVASEWGKRVASQLALQPNYHVIGLDSDQPKQEIPKLDFIQADIRNPLLADLMKSEMVDTVVHLAITETQQPTEASFDLNVMGTMKVLGACSQALVRKVILKSSTVVYGARPDNSAFITEESTLRGSTSYGYARDLMEIESFCNGFRMQSPEIILTILRYPSIIGPTTDSPMTRFLKEMKAPILLGFDPMMQIIHENDVTDSMIHAVNQDVPGVYNVAADGILPLKKLIAVAGKIPLPVFHLFAYWGANLMSSGGLGRSTYIPIEPDYIRYPWVADTTRMQTELCFSPRYTAEEALREFAGHQRMSIYKTESATMAYDVERLRDTIERRTRIRKMSPDQAISEDGGSSND